MLCFNHAHHSIYFELKTGQSLLVQVIKTQNLSIDLIILVIDVNESSLTYFLNRRDFPPNKTFSRQSAQEGKPLFNNPVINNTIFEFMP